MIPRLAMRISAARALRGATLADDRVFDSAIDPIDQTIADQRAPILIVTTDDGESEIDGRDIIARGGNCDLVIEVAIASRVVVNNEEISLEIPHTDEGMELALDIIEHQVIAALTHGRSEWSNVWMALVPRVIKRITRRGASSENGVRFAARQIVLVCDVIGAPAPGEALPPSSALAKFFALASADEALAPTVGLMRSVIEGEPRNSWERAANDLGIPLDVADKLGLGTVLSDGALSADPDELLADGDVVIEINSELEQED